MTTQHTLAPLLQRLHKKSGLSMRQVAELSGIDVAAVSRIHSGQRTKPRAETLIKLAEVYATDASELLSAAGYAMKRADALPSMRPYLRTKYKHLPADARQQLEALTAKLEAEYGSRPKGRTSEK